MARERYRNVLAVGVLAEALAADVQDAVSHGEDLLRVVALAVAEPGGPAGEVLAVEELDGFGGSGRLFLVVGRNRSQAERGEEGERQERGPAEVTHAAAPFGRAGGIALSYRRWRGMGEESARHSCLGFCVECGGSTP